MALALGLHAASGIGEYDSPRHVLAEVVNNCAFGQPGEYTHGPYSRSIRVCRTSPREPVLALISHMRRQSHGMDASFGAEFGSNVRVIYIPYMDLPMINPSIVSQPGMTTECTDSIGLDVITRTRQRHIQVGYLTPLYEPAIISLSDGDACVIQAIMDYF